MRQNAYNQPDLADILPDIVPDHQAILAAIKARDLPKAQTLLLAAHATNDRVFRQQIEQDALIQTPEKGGDALG